VGGGAGGVVNRVVAVRGVRDDRPARRAFGVAHVEQPSTRLAGGGSQRAAAADGVAFLRNSAGGIASGASALAILPVFQTALYSRSRRDLLLVLIGLALFFVVPIVLVGPPAYPHTQYRAALLAVAVDGIIGLATQRLVARVRLQAKESRGREQMLGQVSEVVHSLFDSPQPRVDVCEAARTISHASAALLYEPTGNSDQLVCSALAGIDMPAEQLTVDRRSAAYEAFRSGRPKLITQNVEAHIGLIELWIASGRPASLLYQPLLNGNDRLGVLVIGWPNELRAEGPRATVAALLAHEVAAVIARADAMDELTDEAQTDGLTGLPNRRTWEAHLTRAGSARIGGEEFGHLLGRANRSRPRRKRGERRCPRRPSSLSSQSPGTQPRSRGTPSQLWMAGSEADLTRR